MSDITKRGTIASEKLNKEAIVTTGVGFGFAGGGWTDLSIDGKRIGGVSTVHGDVIVNGCPNIVSEAFEKAHPRRVECKDCTYWNPGHALKGSGNIPRFWGVGVCEKTPHQRATGYQVACYEGHYDASLWPKRNILMRKF